MLATLSEDEARAEDENYDETEDGSDDDDDDDDDNEEYEGRQQLGKAGTINVRSYSKGGVGGADVADQIVHINPPAPNVSNIKEDHSHTVGGGSTYPVQRGKDVIASYNEDTYKEASSSVGAHPPVQVEAADHPQNAGHQSGNAGGGKAWVPVVDHNPDKPAIDSGGYVQKTVLPLSEEEFVAQSQTDLAGEEPESLFVPDEVEGSKRKPNRDEEGERKRPLVGKSLRSVMARGP